MARLIVSSLKLRNTPQALLTYRILASLAVNTDLIKFLGRENKVKLIPGEPTKTDIPPTPSIHVWFERTAVQINANGSLQDITLDGHIKVRFSSTGKYESVLFDETTGKFKDPIPLRDEDHTPLLEAYWIEYVLRDILEQKGYDNNWYYTFVENGVRGGPGQLYFNYRSIVDPTRTIIQELDCSFKTDIWSEDSERICDGAATVTVTRGGSPVSGATVVLTDAFGNYVEDTSGIYKWTTNGSGVATISGIVCQSTVTWTATSGVYVGTSSGSILQAGNTVAITLS